MGLRGTYNFAPLDFLPANNATAYIQIHEFTYSKINKELTPAVPATTKLVNRDGYTTQNTNEVLTEDLNNIFYYNVSLEDFYTEANISEEDKPKYKLQGAFIIEVIPAIEATFGIRYVYAPTLNIYVEDAEGNKNLTYQKKISFEFENLLSDVPAGLFTELKTLPEFASFEDILDEGQTI